MKTILIIPVYIWCLAYMAIGAPVTLAWDANPATDGITAYELRYTSDLSTGWQSVKVVAATQHTLDLPSGEYHFEVVAVAGNARSLPSNRVMHTVLPSSPTRFRVVIEGTMTISPAP